jgi:hypothetical protein
MKARFVNLQRLESVLDVVGHLAVGGDMHHMGCGGPGGMGLTRCVCALLRPRLLVLVHPSAQQNKHARLECSLFRIHKLMNITVRSMLGWMEEICPKNTRIEQQFVGSRCAESALCGFIFTTQHPANTEHKTVAHHHWTLSSAWEP